MLSLAVARKSGNFILHRVSPATSSVTKISLNYGHQHLVWNGIHYPSGTLRHFSTRVILKPAKSGSNKSFWKRFATFVKVTRIPFLVVALYSLGYQQGVLDTVRNPRKIQQAEFEQICMLFGANEEKVDIVYEKHPPNGWNRLAWSQKTDDHDQDNTVKDPRANLVANIGREIIRAARKHIRNELAKVVEQKKKSLQGRNLDTKEMQKLILRDERFVFWTKAFEHIQGYTTDGIQNWQYILIQSDIPNAFVTEMLPQRVFVTTGLFDKFVDTDDELAMIMGHEISHLIHGHGSESTWSEFMIRGLEIAFLMLDPTDGVLSLFFASFFSQTRNALIASKSREDEREADELGCKLCAMACFDTKAGSNVFLKMHEYDVKNNTATRSIMSSHPPSAERYQFVKQLSNTVNPEEFSYCEDLKRQIGRSLAIRSNSEGN